MIIKKYLEFIQESKNEEFFNYKPIASNIWSKLLREAMDQFKIKFDTENDDPVNSKREIVIPQNEWKFTKCKFKCSLCSAGGDWQIPIYYFRCQLVKGYAFEKSIYSESAFFIFIPGKTEGNYHLVKCNNGEDWCAPDDNVYKEGIDPERNERDCWKSLNKYLKNLVDLEIEKVRSKNK